MATIKESELELVTEEENVKDDSDNESTKTDNDYGDDDDDENLSVDSNVIESEENIEDLTKEEIVPKEKRITRPFMTKYEYVRIIGTRRKQLSLGAKPMIKIDGKLSINEIVNEEIKANMIPFKIKRPLPDSNKVEIWNFDELEKEHLL